MQVFIIGLRHIIQSHHYVRTVKVGPLFMLHVSQVTIQETSKIGNIYVNPVIFVAMEYLINFMLPSICLTLDVLFVVVAKLEYEKKMDDLYGID